MEELLEKFVNRAPEVVFEWNDRETEAKGWTVINSLRGGAAGGGTRMRVGLTRNEVASLAKVMEVKFTVSGPPIGGAKSGINFDPHDPRKDGVLKRWYKAVYPLLRSYYGTGGDLNVDEIRDVIPITEDLGLLHPQAGIVRGHFDTTEIENIDKIGQLRKGVAKQLEVAKFAPALDRHYTVADMITGYGVAESVVHYYSLYGGNLSDKRVIIQGWGNVAGAAGFYLAQKGAKIVGIIDRSGGLIRPKGMLFEEVRDLFLKRKNNCLTEPNLIPYEEAEEQIWDLPAEVFIPGAASRLVTLEKAQRLIEAGLEVMSCGANVPFDEDEHLFGPVTRFVDSKISLIPDFIANAGMARVFANLMSRSVWVRDEEIFRDVSDNILKAMSEVREYNDGWSGISETALEIALRKLV